MDVKLDNEHERQLRQLAEVSGRTVSKVLDAIVREGLEHRRALSVDASTAEAKRLVERIRALPEEDPENGFRGRDHDAVLYPVKP